MKKVYITLLIITLIIIGFQFNQYKESKIDIENSNKERDYLTSLIQIKTLSLQVRQIFKQYIIDPKQEDLDSYYVKLQKLENKINNTKFQENLEVHLYYQTWIEYLNNQITDITKFSQSKYTMNDIITKINTQKGKKYFDIFRKKIAAFITTEEYLLKSRQESFKDSIKSTDQISAAQVDKNVKMVDHTHEVIIEAKNLLTYGLNIETGARGYFITGNKTFLEPYDNSVKVFSKHLAALKKKVSDNPEQISALKVINKHMRVWIEEIINPLIAMRTEIGDLSLQENKIKNLMDKKERELFTQYHKEIDKGLFKKKGEN